jgi:hypothetical protein
VKEMYLEELMDVVVVVKLSTALLKMLNPVETRVLDLWRKTLLYSTMLYVSHKCTRSLLSANILLERVRHKPDTVIGQCLMRLLLVYPEVRIGTSVFAKEEVAK